MDRISFKNFRKFKDEKSFDLNNINILVGKNNSGKSTLTKGLRLYLKNILNLQINSTKNGNIFSYRPLFQFGGDSLDNPHIGTFGRAISKDAQDDKISFLALFSDLSIETIVSRYSTHYKNQDGIFVDFIEEPTAPITKIVFTKKNQDVRFTFDFECECLIAEFNITGEVDYYSNWSNEIDLLKEKIASKDISDEDKDHLAFNLKRLEKCVSFGLKDKAKYVCHLSPICKDGNRVQGQLYLEIIRNLIHFMTDKSIEENEGLNKFMTKGKLLFSYLSQIIYEISWLIENYINKEYIKNIEAHSVTHSLVYNISNKNDYMAQTILEYINENIKDNDEEKIFIEKWMMKFEIGEDFVIDSYGGESYKLEIIEDVDNPEIRTPLLDKGVGSNQIMILLLQLATIMHRNRGSLVPYIVVIEEPEQNLHPALQSNLADLLYEVYQYPQKINNASLGITFVVETHSEYLVRKSQVLVAQQVNDEDNPFTVYYLEENRQPRKMEYQDNGTFSNDFGEGFYDESIRLTEEII